MTASVLPRVTIRDRAIASEADRIGRMILAKCYRLIRAHEVVVAEPADVPEGKPLVSLLLHRIGAEAHAYRQSTICADLATELREAAGNARDNRAAVLRRIAALVERISGEV